MNYAILTPLLLLLPLLGFAILGIWGPKYLLRISGIVGTGIMLATTILCLYTAYRYFFVDGKTNDVYQPIIGASAVWLPFGYKDLSIDMGVMLDQISVMMLVVISVVSLMVHVYSLAYMKGEKRLATYFAFLSLFTFSMLGLVLSVNLFQIYIFWELVGVSSFLLIGFYYEKPAAVAASKKAFIVTRFADLFFLIGILILGMQAGTFDFPALIQRLTNPESEAYLALATGSFAGISLLTWGLVLVFVGGAGKSAMFPLHVWLPDAMEGPTPVSALIHAATMVVAGVFLVARLFPVYSMQNVSLDIVAWVGALSALLAAVMACTQTDFKRILAYSTMSQIGYMMFALGVSRYGSESSLGYTASMFHLFTHAFFKALLFLGAGVVIHFVHTNDVNQMGGLRKFLPITHITFLVACLAISGIPPLSGFFSKEEILWASWQNHRLVFGIALLTAGLTAFYMFRLYFLVFWNKSQPASHQKNEGPAAMKWPLVFLAIATVLVGFIPFGNFVSASGSKIHPHLPLLFSTMPLLISVLGIAFAYRLYKQENTLSTQISSRFKMLYRWSYHTFYIDEIYRFITLQIIFPFVGRPAAWADKHVVNASINAIGNGTEKVARIIRGWQSGKIQQYVFYFFTGVCALALLMIYLWN